MATECAKRIDLNGYKDNRAGTVAAAILSTAGHIYTGINVHTACDLGFCAEASAISDMLKHGESEIRMIVAVTYHGEIIPPCGRCREFMVQVNTKNLAAKILIDKKTVKTLADLLPYNWEVSKKTGAIS
ncbi:MAG: cytidine deaminase [Proteobacteria bacterium]|nr:cytidine deaminase [Pseudomonadota bacterium]